MPELVMSKIVFTQPVKDRAIEFQHDNYLGYIELRLL
jgi:hypothetical protein